MTHVIKPSYGTRPSTLFNQPTIEDALSRFSVLAVRRVDDRD